MDIWYVSNNYMGIAITGVIILILFLKGLRLIIEKRADLYKNTLLRNVFTKNKVVWVQRIFLTMTLIMLFFNFFSTGYAVGSSNSQTTPSTPQVSAKVAATANDNSNIYRGLYVQLLQNLETNEQQYLTNFKDIEALGSILQDINNSIGGIKGYEFSAKVPVFKKLFTDVLNFTFEQRDVNATKFFFNTTSNTIFVAETLDHFGLLDLPLNDITALLGKNATSDTIFTELTNKTLREVFRQSLLIEFVNDPVAIAPTNEKYEPALSHALSIGILKLSDLGLPDNGLTYDDYINGLKPTIEIDPLTSTIKSGVVFGHLQNSSFTVSGQNSANITIPTYGDFFTLAQLEQAGLSNYYAEQLLQEVVPYNFILQLGTVPDALMNPVTQSMNLIYWSNMTVVYYNYTYPTYSYVYNDTLQDYEYELVNQTDQMPYYLESQGQWIQHGNTWTYDNATSGTFVWNQTTLSSMGLTQYQPNYGLNVTISGTNYANSISTETPSLQEITGKIDHSTTPNQTVVLNLAQQIYKNGNITYSNNTILDLFANRTLFINDSFYYFPLNLFPENVSDIQLPIDMDGNYIAPAGTVLLTNMSQLANYLTTYNQTQTVLDFVNQNINFNFTVLLPELALGDYYNHTDLGYLTLIRDVSENWVVHTYSLLDTGIAKNYDRNYPDYEIYFATGLDSYYRSPDTLFIFERPSVDEAQAFARQDAVKQGDIYNQTLIKELTANYMPIGQSISINESFDLIVRNYQHQKDWDIVQALFTQSYATLDTTTTLESLDNILASVKDEKLLRLIMG